MAYGALYTLTWESLFGESQSLEIQQRDYDSGSTNIVLKHNPISITYDSPNDFVYYPINGSRATIRLVAQTTFQFRELYTNTAIEYKVIFKNEGAVKWVGCTMPKYNKKYTAAPYTIELIASEQLGVLKNLDWDRGHTTMSEIEALGYIFEKTDLELDMQEGINCYEDNHNDTADDSPLDQTWFDGEAFEGKSYYDVLYHILFKYLAILKQQDGEWFIFRPRECGYVYNLRKWIVSGDVFTYDSYQVYNPMLAVTPANVDFDNLVRIGNGAGENALSGWKNYVLKHNLGLREAYNENYNFENWYYLYGDIPEDWIPTGTAPYGRSGNKLRIEPYHTAPADPDWLTFTQNPSLTSVDPNSSFKIVIEYTVYVVPGNTMQVYFAFGNGPRWYDPNTGIWETTKSYIVRQYTGAVDEFPKNDKIEIITPVLNFPLTTLQVFAPILNTGSDFSDCYVEVDMFASQLLHRESATNTQPYPEEVDYSNTIDPDHKHKPADMEILLGDSPDSGRPNAMQTWKGILFRDALQKIPTLSWNADGRSGPLAELMDYAFDDFFQNTQQIITGGIYTKLLNPCNVIIETNDSNRPYIIKRATWHPKLNRWDVEMHELPFEISLGSSGTPEPPGDGWLILESDSGALLLESSGKILEE